MNLKLKWTAKQRLLLISILSGAIEHLPPEAVYTAGMDIYILAAESTDKINSNVDLQGRLTLTFEYINLLDGNTKLYDMLIGFEKDKE